MSWMEDLLIIAGLLLDIFAAMACHGALVAKINKKGLFLVSLIVGACQLAALYLGYFLATVMEGKQSISGSGIVLAELIAIIIFFALAARLIYKAIKNEPVMERREEKLGYKRFLRMAAMTAFYTLLAGIAFGFLKTGVITILIMVVVVTIVYVIAGMYMGYHLGAQPKRKVYFIGAGLLIVAGIDVIIRCALNVI